MFPHEVKITEEITKFEDGIFINEHNIIEKIGEGKFGKVYKIAPS